MFDPDSGHATSGSAGWGSVDPRPSGSSPSVVVLTTLAGCQQGGPPVKAGGPPTFWRASGGVPTTHLLHGTGPDASKAAPRGVTGAGVKLGCLVEGWKGGHGPIEWA